MQSVGFSFYNWQLDLCIHFRKLLCIHCSGISPDTTKFSSETNRLVPIQKYRNKQCATLGMCELQESYSSPANSSPTPNWIPINPYLLDYFDCFFLCRHHSNLVKISFLIAITNEIRLFFVTLEY